MRRLTEKEITLLQSFKGQPDGANKFFAELEVIFQGDTDTLAEIRRCKDMRDSLDLLDTYPAHGKSQHMFYQFMDDLLSKIGYRK